MTRELYAKARKLGLKEYHARMQRQENPYLPVLFEIEGELNALSRVPLGLIQVPLNKIVGTASKGRTNAFAANFMPLLDPGSEFCAKWCRLYEGVSRDGLRQPVTVLEYLNKFYLVEGNKRVSVMKYLDAVSIEAEVTRVIPKRTDELENKIYFEFLPFYKDTQINYIWFSRLGGFERVYALTGKQPGERWDEDERRNFETVYTRFRSEYKALNGDRLPITTGDAFLVYLDACGYEGACQKFSQEIRPELKALWGEFEKISNEENIALIMQPEEVKKNAGAGLLNSLFGPSCVNVAFMYDKTPRQSRWTYWHDLGRINLENALGDKVKTTVCLCNNPENFEQEIERLIEEGNKLIFTISPLMLKAAMKASVKHPEAKILNCSLLASWKRVRSYYLRLYEVKFLLGMIAGALSESDKIGYVADYPIYGMASSINAFALGARTVNPRAKIYLNWFTREDFDPEHPFLDPEIQIISSRDVGMPDHSMEYGLYMLKNGEKSNIAIPVFDWSRIYESLVRSILNGTWKDQADENGAKALNYWWGISSNAIDIIMSRRLDPKVKRLVELVKEQMRQGEFFAFEGEIRDQSGELRCTEDSRLSPADVITMDWLADNVIGCFPEMEELKESAKALVEIQGIREIRQPDASWFSWRAEE